MKLFINPIFLSMALLACSASLQAQVDLQNNGTLYISGASDILFINGGFTNASGAALTNNGNLHVKQNLVNGQSSMAVGTGTLYLNGTGAQAVNGAQLFKTFNLVTNNTAGITLNNDLSVSGVHTFSAGDLTTSVTPNYLIYEAGASYTGDGDASHVNGWVRKSGTTAFAFPLGNGTVERRISISSLSAAAVFNANYAGATTNLGNLALPLRTVDPNEYWIVNRVSGGTANIDMNWDNSKVAMPNYALADIRVANYIGGNWTSVGTGATGNTTTTGNISATTLASFGSFALGSVSFILPVNLVQFSASKNNGTAMINWTTTDEINVGYYEVQRSDDGIVFYTIGTVAARNQTDLQQYQFADSQPLKEQTYYRLRSVDIDGKTKLSKVVKISNLNMGAYLTVANPVHNAIHITAGNTGGVFEYRINTLGGQTVRGGSINITGSVAEIPLPASFKGVYILQMQKAGFNFVQKIVVQ